MVLLSAFSMFFLLYCMMRAVLFGDVFESTSLSLLNHYQATKCLGWATLIHIILIKIGVVIKGGAKHDVLFFIHLLFAVIFTFSILLLCYSYKEIVKYHQVLTIIASFSYIFVAGIGIPMLFKRF